MEKADILIAGGGAVGLTLALALRCVSERTLDVAVFDPALESRGRGPRSTALAPGPVAMLQRLGVWDMLAADAQPIARMEIGEGGEGAAAPSLTFVETAERGPLGYMVFLHDLEGRLLERCQAEHVRLRSERVSDFRIEGAAAFADVPQGAWRGRLAVGADGAQSRAAQAAGIAYREWSYDRSALVVTVGHAYDHNGVSSQIFLQHGPLAALPMTCRRTSIVWTQTPEQVQAFLADPARLMERLTELVGPRLGALSLLDAPSAFPLAFRVATRFAGERLALVGDAGHRVHPLAGQGLNLGFRDAAWLAEIVREHAVDGLDFGTASALSRYESRRKFDVVSSGLAFDLLHRAYATNIAGATALRRTALQAADRIHGLKRFLVAEAAGLRGATPPLFRDCGL